MLVIAVLRAVRSGPGYTARAIAEITAAIRIHSRVSMPR